MQKLNHGYKGKTCFDKNGLACAAGAPPLNKKVVKNLYQKFGITSKGPYDFMQKGDVVAKRKLEVKNIAKNKEAGSKKQPGAKTAKKKDDEPN